jgi:hypothetical protein
MSQQPPPPPYGGPPGSYPPAPYPSQGPGRPGGMSNKAKFWIGVALSIPALIVAGIVTGAGSALADGLGAGSDASAIVSSFLGLLLFVGFIASLVIEKTRWFAIGILAGLAVLLILAAGACIVLLVAFANSFS